MKGRIEINVSSLMIYIMAFVKLQTPNIEVFSIKLACE